MKIVVAVVVYNRLDNLKRWINCWKQCNQEGAELVVIHTGSEVETPDYVWPAAVKYILRKNIGFDIGCFQDVCRGRLPNFPKWDYLLWCTDDCIPMQKDFIQPFINTIKQGAGIAAMQVAVSMAGEQHVRTTGFMITDEVASKLTFPADPVLTKQQCYLFEHRGANTMTNQIRKMGLSCQQVSPNKTSPMWDTGYWKRLDRQAEHNQVFGCGKPKGNKVTFICTIYNSYPQIISSLMCQTHNNWELILIHDGPNDTGIRSHHINGDIRIKYIETQARVGNWGHSLRQWALSEIKEGRLSDPDYIVVSNADNYYVPTFIEYMLKGFEKNHTAVATYCDSMTHSYVAWKNIPVRFEKGFIDCGGVMVKKDIAVEIGWRDIQTHSSDWTYFSDIAAKYSARNFIPVKGNLFIHN